METLGDYDLLQLIGEGATGVVHRAEHRRSRQQVALKILHPEVTRTPEARRQMVAELVQLVSLSHPGVVCCRECREIDDRVVLAYELVSGLTLRAQLEREGRMEWRDAVRIGVQIADALAAAHQLAPPILHRDLRPENIMITTSNTVKVTDFGIARVLGAAGQTTTATFGNITYMSPEQIDAFSIDARSDIYCLGLVLYELVTGSVPFKGSPRALVNAQCTQPPPPFPDSLRVAVPADLEAVIRWMLEKSPDARPSSAQEVSRLLNAVLTGEPVRVPAATSPAMAPAPSRATPAPVAEPIRTVAATPRPSTPVGLIVGLAIVMLLIVGGGLGIGLGLGPFGERESEPPTKVAEATEVATEPPKPSEQPPIAERPTPPTAPPDKQQAQPDTPAEPLDASDGTTETGGSEEPLDATPPDESEPVAPTEPEDPAVAMLLGTHLCSLQWSSGHGTCEVTKQGDELQIDCQHKRAGLVIRGDIDVEDDRTFFVDGSLKVVAGCCGTRNLSGRFKFKRNGSRKYWRLQEPMRSKICSECLYYIDIFMKKEGE